MCKYTNTMTQEQLDKIMEMKLPRHNGFREYLYPMEYQVVQEVCVEGKKPSNLNLRGFPNSSIYQALSKAMDALEVI